MDQAVIKAIYYTNVLSGNVISEYQYSNKDTFYELIKGFRNDINIRNIFGSVDNVCYQICDTISQSYDQLLLDNIDCLLIITRKDNAILLSRSSNPKTSNPKRVAVIKIDSVLAELNLKQAGSSKITYFLFAAVTAGLIWNGIYEKVISF